jgi:hypothetical protein
MDWRHAIEQMGGLPRTRGNRRERLLVRSAGVSERNAVPARDEPPDQIECALELRRERHDPDIRCRALDFGEDVRTIEVSTGP